MELYIQVWFLDMWDNRMSQTWLMGFNKQLVNTDNRSKLGFLES